jgi:protein gp37
MAATKIPWAEKTWNPIIGCTKVSAGCLNCYAERMARRQVAMGNMAYDGVVDDMHGHWTGQLNFVEDALDAPLRWKKPCRIFVCSMSDIFHPNSETEWLEKVFKVFDDCKRRGINHIFILLTKRPGMALSFFESLPYGKNGSTWLNIWMGVTIEEEAESMYRLAKLQALKPFVSKIFVSCEPLLGYVDLGPAVKVLDWVIAGSESGPGARPMGPDWARSLRDQCVGSGVPFFLKQMTGIKPPKHCLPALDGKTWGEFPR